MKKLNLSSRFWTAEGGTAGAELALILPVLLLLLFGIMELGRLMHDYHVVSKGVRDATRYLTRVPVDCTGGVPSGPTATELTVAKNLAMSADYNTGSISAGDHLLGYWTNPNSIAISTVCQANGGNYLGVYRDDDFIPRLTVTATVPFAFMFGTFIASAATFSMVVSHNQVGIGE